MLERSGGFYHSKSLSDESRNFKQIKNRKQPLKSSSKYNKQEWQTNDELTTVFNALENENIAQTISAVKPAYFLLLYNDRQINNIKNVCCEDSKPSVLPIDATLNLCNLRITDTSYRNKRFINRESEKNLIFLGRIMFYFTKGEGDFGQFALELLAADPKLVEPKNLGVDMQSAICQGFTNFIPSINRLLCVRHLKHKYEEKLDKLLNRLKQNAVSRQQAKSSVLQDIYGCRTDTSYRNIQQIRFWSKTGFFTRKVEFIVPRTFWLV